MYSRIIIITIAALLYLPALSFWQTTGEITCEKIDRSSHKYTQCLKKKKMKKCLDECVVNPKIGQTQDYCDCICNGGVKLNTNIPFIGRCISLGDDSVDENSTTVTQISAFPKLMRALMIKYLQKRSKKHVKY